MWQPMRDGPEHHKNQDGPVHTRMDGRDTASLPPTRWTRRSGSWRGVGAEANEVVCDKATKSNKTMPGVADLGMRSYVERAQPRPPELAAGTRRLRSRPMASSSGFDDDRGKRLLRQRREKLERGFARLPETGGWIHAAAFNLGLLMRKAVRGWHPPAWLAGPRRCASLTPQHPRLAQPDPASARSSPQLVRRMGSNFCHALLGRLGSYPCSGGWGDGGV